MSLMYSYYYYQCLAGDARGAKETSVSTKEKEKKKKRDKNRAYFVDVVHNNNPPV